MNFVVYFVMHPVFELEFGVMYLILDLEGGACFECAVVELDLFVGVLWELIGGIVLAVVG